MGDFRCRLYAWGSNSDGQLGLDEDDASPSEGRPRSQTLSGRDSFEALPVPLRALDDIPVAQVSCGSRHSLVLTRQGILYTFGWGKCGQLGHGDTRDRRAPTVVTALAASGGAGGRGRRVVKVSAGGIHSAALTESGTVYTWGEASYGQLGQGVAAVRQRMVLAPKELVWQREEGGGRSAGFERPAVASISCGGQHTGVVTVDGRAFCFGRADSGQCGVGQSWIDLIADAPEEGGSSSAILGKMQGLEVPHRVVGLPDAAEDPAAAIACGAFHSLCVTRSGRCFAWGNEEYGMLGVGRSRDWRAGVVQPREITGSGLGSPNGPYADGIGKKVRSVAAAGWHSCFLTEHGTLLSCGRGEYGRMGFGDEKDRRLPHVLQVPGGARVLRVAPGGTHTAVLASGAVVYTSGRGDGGRLGHGDLSDRHGLARVDALLPEALGGLAVVAVDAGGQHNLAVAVDPRGDNEAAASARGVLAEAKALDLAELPATPRSPLQQGGGSPGPPGAGSAPALPTLDRVMLERTESLLMGDADGALGPPRAPEGGAAAELQPPEEHDAERCGVPLWRGRH